MRPIELTGAGAELAPLLDELARLVELQDAVVPRAVSFRNEDVAVGRDQDVVRLIEIVWRRGAARLAERQQQLAVGTELVHLIPFGRAGPRSDRARRRFAARPSATTTRCAAARTALWKRRVVLAIGHPDVAVAVDENPVRENEQPLAETLHELARRIELQQDRQIRHLSAGAIETAVR